MTRFALLVSFVVVGCSVPTPVGELQQAVAGSGATSTTQSPAEDTLSSSSSASPTSSAPTGSSTAPASGSSTGDAIVAGMTSFAIRRAELPDNDPTDTSDTVDTVGSGVGTGSIGDPDDLLVTFGFTSASCLDPSASDSCGTWAATLTLSPEQQVTGTYTDAEVDGFFVEQGPNQGNDDCFGTGGSLTGFTIILEAIDETGLEMVFEGNGVGPIGVDLNGMSFSVPRC